MAAPFLTKRAARSAVQESESYGLLNRSLISGPASGLMFSACSRFGPQGLASSVSEDRLHPLRAARGTPDWGLGSLRIRILRKIRTQLWRAVEETREVTLLKTNSRSTFEKAFEAVADKPLNKTSEAPRSEAG